MDEGIEVLENLPSGEWVRVSDFADGDICVLKFPGVLPRLAIDRLKRQMRSVFTKAGRQVNVVILEEGAQIEMLRHRPGSWEK